MSAVNIVEISQRLQHYASLEYLLIGDMRDVLDEVPDDQTRRWLLAVVDALLEILPREFECEDEKGYLQEVLEQFPNWFELVRRLHDEHQILFVSLKELRDQIDLADPYEELPIEVTHGLHEWMIRATAHHRHENRIVQSAFDLEIGGEG